MYLNANDLPGDLRPAVIDLLYRLADDALVIGHRNSEWTGLGPILEEDIAFSSMSQDKIGHALAYYRLLHDLGEPEPDALAFGRSAEAYRCCHLVSMECLGPEDGESGAALRNNPVRDALVRRGDFAGSFMRQFLFSEADSIRMKALEESAYEPLAQLARKFRGELKYHVLHGRTLLARLGRSTEDGRGRLQSALERFYPHAMGLFEPSRHDEILNRHGISPKGQDLMEQWRLAVEGLLAESGLTIPCVTGQPGGRMGGNRPELSRLLDDMQRVYRLDPAASW